MSDKIKQETKLKIKANLPYGYVSQLFTILNKEYSKSYIGQVCNPENERWNDKIISAASSLAVKNAKKNADLKKNISKLSA